MRYELVALVVFCTLSAVSAGQVRCYQCISSVNENCDDSDLEDLEKYNKVCPRLTTGTFKGQEAVGCRKISQNVEDDDEVIIRECAYTGEEVDGQKKSGNWAIHKYFYQCVNEEDSKPCNSVNSVFSVVSLLVCSLVALLH